MRDAFGGVFMIRIMLVFIFIFISFTAVSLNYAKAFRVKNYVIDIVEQEELFSLDRLDSDKSAIDKLDAILSKTGYHKECRNGNGRVKHEPGEGDAYCYNGIVIKESQMIGNTIVYDVYTYATWDLKTLNLIFALGGERKSEYSYVTDGTWKISGEARVVKRNYKKN